MARSARLPDELYQRVADIVRERPTHKFGELIAAEFDVPITTAHMYIRRAVLMGLVPARADRACHRCGIRKGDHLNGSLMECIRLLRSALEAREMTDA